MPLENPEHSVTCETCDITALNSDIKWIVNLVAPTPIYLIQAYSSYRMLQAIALVKV